MNKKYLPVILLATSSSVVANQNVETLETITLSAEKQMKDNYRGGGNMDIPRTEDDIQPYTVINSETIENSGATNVSEVLNKVLTTNTSTPNRSGSGFTGTTSQINLRGLGANHTLVLINGRRSAGMGNRGTAELSDQPNLDNIPLSAIDRIEVLPTSASAIYGSSAIGGVINVILKKDYIGSEVNLKYQNTIDDKQPVKSLNLVTGFSLEDGRTQVMFTASKEDQDELTQSEMDWRTIGRNLRLKNNPNLIYGAKNPPSGHLTNINTADGSELIPNSGSSIAHIPKGWNGDIQQLGAGYALDLADGMSAWSGDTPLITESKSEYYGISINRDFTDKLNAYIEGSYAEEKAKHHTSPHGYGTVNFKANNPVNPFGKEVNVTFPVKWDSMGEKAHRITENKTKRLAVGFTYDIHPEWVLSADYAWSRANILINYPRKGSYNPNALAWTSDLKNGDIDLFQDLTSVDTNLFDLYWNYPKTQTQSTLNDFALRAAGSLYNWYAGDIKLATGLEYRKIDTEGFADHQHVDNPWRKPTERHMNAGSLYGELNIPFISPEMEIPWIKHFDMQLAGRYERFDVKARTPIYVENKITQYKSTLTGYDVQEKVTYDDFTPTIGFSLAPNDQVMLRASYSEGFITPDLTSLAESTLGTSSSTTLTDPVTGEILSEYNSISGGNPSLTPESSKSWNFGIVFTPEMISGLRLSVDYFNIKKKNNITTPTAEYLLANEAQFPNKIQRDENGKILSIDTTPFNALGLKTEGFDTNLRYSFDSFVGQSQLGIGYTYTSKYEEQKSLTSDWESRLGGSASGDPIRHRANASFVLQPTDQWSFGWATQYYGHYNITDENAILSQTGTKSDKLRINGEFFHDVFARYTLNTPSLKNSKTEVTFGINNLFDTATLDMSDSDYISRYTDPLGRNYYLNLKMSF